MDSHIPIEDFQKVFEDEGGSYTIALPDDVKAAERHRQQKEERRAQMPKGATYYCPMHCEGDKTYDKPGDCPVCGMDLVEEQNLGTVASSEWTCPMHPEIVKEEPGSCPLCGMDLVFMQPNLSAEETTYHRLRKKFWIATAFTLPIFLVA